MKLKLELKLFTVTVKFKYWKLKVCTAISTQLDYDISTSLGVVNLFFPGKCLPQPIERGSVLTLTGSLSSPRHKPYSHALGGEGEGRGSIFIPWIIAHGPRPKN